MSAVGQSQPLLGGASSRSNDAAPIHRRHHSSLTSHVTAGEGPSPRHKWVIKCCFEDVELTWAQVLFAMGLICLIVYCTIDLLTRQDTLNIMEDLIDWLADTNVFLVMLIIIAIETLWITALLPMSVVVMSTAYIMGEKYAGPPAFFLALITVYIGYFFGASLAFNLGRHILRSCAIRFIAHIRVLTAVDHIFISNGRKMNILLRVNPLVPYNIFNYAMGMTSSTYTDFAWGTVGALPSTFMELYAGLLINNVNNIDNVYGRTSPEWIVTYILMATIFIGSGVLIYRTTYVEWRKVMAHIDDTRPMTTTDGGADTEEDELSGGDGDGSTSFGTFTPGAVMIMAQPGSP